VFPYRRLPAFTVARVVVRTRTPFWRSNGHRGQLKSTRAARARDYGV
jgi:hypothetical protein